MSVKNTGRLGIMQGRLSPPVNNRIQAFPHGYWQNEFALCAGYGLGCIEWLYEYDPRKKNPLDSDEGIAEIVKLRQEYDVQVNSVLADYFMIKKLFGSTRAEVKTAVENLKFLIRQCGKCAINIIEIPFVDASALNTEKDKREAIENLLSVLDLASINNVVISLETSLPPVAFHDLICFFDSPFIKVNYDMGNSAAMGFDPWEEIELLGEFIANVHIKDRIKGGGTVPLGTGDTDFSAVFGALKEKGYEGDFILQAARQDIDNCAPERNIEETVSSYINFVKPLLRDFV